MLKLTYPYRLYFIATIILSILISGVSPLRPYLTKVAIDNFIKTKEGFYNFSFDSMILLIAVVLVSETFLRYSFSLVSSWLGQNVIKDLRDKVFEHIVQLKLRYYDQTPIGNLITRTISDIENINTIYTDGFVPILTEFLTIFILLSVMFITDWRLCLVSISVFPILLYGTHIFQKSVKKSFERVRIEVSKMNTFLQEHISGMSIVQAFNAQSKEFYKFKKINEDQLKAHNDSNFAYSVYMPFVEILSAVGIGLVVWWGTVAVLHHNTTEGIMVAFIMYINMLFRPVRFLADKFNSFQMGMISAERVFELLDNKQTIPNEGNFIPETIEGNIEFKNVHFAYDDANNVLQDISFQVKKGETLAIVGATGSGKSSIINVLSRMYEIQKGEILIDKRNIKEYELNRLLSQIALVLQDVFLFNASIMDNITLRNSNITRAQVEQAAKIIGAHEYIMQIPGNYDYIVRERGLTLSNGQRQLISFVRALVCNPKILILDEATASIDSQSEAVIQYAIEKLIEKRTSIIIAHRLSTIQHAHRIMVMEKGKIAEQGTHFELMEKNGLYKKLYDLQFNNHQYIQ